jgi:hypothetical protein
MNNLDNKYIISEFLAIDPDVQNIKEAIEKNQPIIVPCILQKANTLNRNGRLYPFDILKREVDKYQELVKERSAMGECVPAGTEILTKNGWKDIKDISKDEEIYTLNLDNNNIEIQKTTDKIERKYNDDLVHIYNAKNLDILVTKNHKVIIWDRNNKPKIVLAKDIYDKINLNNSLHHFYIKNGGEWVGEYFEFFNLPESDIKIKSEDWAAFLGIFIAEGHTSGSKGGENRGEVTITQVKEHSKKQIEDLLNKLPFSYTIRQNRQFVIKNDYLFNHLQNLGNSIQKHLPEYTKTWSKDLLNILLEWLLIGDGKNRKNRNGELLREYCTISKKLSEDVEELMLKLGKGSTTSIRIPENRFINDVKNIEKEIEIDGELQLIKEKIKVKRLIKSENSNPLYIIHEKTTDKGSYLDNRFVKTELIPFNDYVYCVSVPNKTWLMKYNGKINWTHNCDHPDSAVISLANVSHIVTEMWWKGETLHGKIQIADTPAGDTVKGLLKTGIKLGISSRGVGSVKKNREGQDVVQEDFELIGFDIVSSPSTPGAYLFKESKQWGMKKLIDSDQKLLKTDDVKIKIKNLKNNLNNLSKDGFWN